MHKILILAFVFITSCTKSEKYGLTRYTFVTIKSTPEKAFVYITMPDGTETYAGQTPIKINLLRNARTPVTVKMLGYVDKKKIIKSTQFAGFINERNNSCYDSIFFGWIFTFGIWNEIFKNANADFCSDTRLSKYEFDLEPINKNGIANQ